MPDSSLKITQITQPFMLQSSFILRDLPIKDLEILEHQSQFEERKRGDILFRQGSYPTGVYFLKTGKIKIYQGVEPSERQTLYIYSDGDLIGYRQFISGEAHPVSAALLEDSTIGFIPADVFRGLIANSTFFARNLLSALASEFTVWMNRMTVFKKFPVQHRLILTLLILHEQYRSSGNADGNLTMTRTDLSEFVGATLETVVRALNKLKALDLVQIHGRQITLPNLSGLIDILQKEK